MRTERQSPWLLPWLLAGLLVAGALVAVLRYRDAPSAAAADEAATTETDIAMVAGDPAMEPPQPADSAEEPRGLSARLLSDSDGARRNLLGMSIRDAGYDCPEVRSADALAPGGYAWRANCGALRLYWIEIDDFGRISVEPGTYSESEFGIDAGGGRTLTIQTEELEQLQEVR